MIVKTTTGSVYEFKDFTPNKGWAFVRRVREDAEGRSLDACVRTLRGVCAVMGNGCTFWNIGLLLKVFR